jgi:hypothetical protein
MNGIDAVALAILCDESGHLTPGTEALRNNNPGNLEIPGLPKDANGKTVFPDFVSGYSALLRDLRAKFSGNNSHGLGPMSTLQQLMNVYAPPSDNNPTMAYAEFVASWVGKALGKPITVVSELSNIWQPPVSNVDDVETALNAT